MKLGCIAGNDEILACPKRHCGKGVIDSIVELPASNVGGLIAMIKQLNVLVPLVAGGGVKHDFVEHHIGRQRNRGSSRSTAVWYHLASQFRCRWAADEDGPRRTGAIDLAAVLRSVFRCFRRDRDRSPPWPLEITLLLRPPCAIDSKELFPERTLIDR